MTFGELLKKLRRAAKMSLRDLAKAADVDVVLLSKVERNISHIPDMGDVAKYAKALGLIQDSEEWTHFMDVALKSMSEPLTVFTEEELQKKVPVFLRTNNEELPSMEVYKKVCELTKAAFINQA